MAHSGYAASPFLVEHGVDNSAITDVDAPQVFLTG
jgi:hypothetical protein